MHKIDVRNVVSPPRHSRAEDYRLSVKVAELSKDGNLQLAQAAQAIVAAFGALHDKGLIPDEALVDLSYRFAGELVDVEEVLGRARRA